MTSPAIRRRVKIALVLSAIIAIPIAPVLAIYAYWWWLFLPTTHERRMDAILDQHLRQPGDRVPVDAIARAAGTPDWRQVCILNGLIMPEKLRPQLGARVEKVTHDLTPDSRMATLIFDDGTDVATFRVTRDLPYLGVPRFQGLTHACFDRRANPAIVLIRRYEAGAKGQWQSDLDLVQG